MNRVGCIAVIIPGLACSRVVETSLGSNRDPPIQPVDFCQELPSLLAPVQLDGELEPGLVAVRMPFAEATWVSIDGLPPTTVPIEYAVAWTESGLYFFGRVADASGAPDPQPIEKLSDAAAFELFVDSDGSFEQPPSRDLLGSAQVIIQAYEPTMPAAHRAALYRNPDIAVPPGDWSSSLSFGTFADSSGGYRVEATIGAAELGLEHWQLISGAHVGFNLAVDIGCAGVRCGPRNLLRSGQLALGVAPQDPQTMACNFPYCDVRSYCRPVLRAP